MQVNRACRHTTHRQADGRHMKYKVAQDEDDVSSSPLLKSLQQFLAIGRRLYTNTPMTHAAQMATVERRKGRRAIWRVWCTAIIMTTVKDAVAVNWYKLATSMHIIYVGREKQELRDALWQYAGQTGR